MSKFELKLPRMGESVAEATLTAWLKEVGDTIELDEPIFEIATDKVDSEVPSEVEGILVEKRFEVDDVVKIGQVVAVIEVEGEDSGSSSDKDDSDATNAGEVSATDQKLENPEAEKPDAGSRDNIKPPKEAATRVENTPTIAAAEVEQTITKAQETADGPKHRPNVPQQKAQQTSDRFYSPLVKNIAQQEGISVAELDTIPGTGKEGRVNKNDILDYVENGKSGGSQRESSKSASSQTASPQTTSSEAASSQPDASHDASLKTGSAELAIDQVKPQTAADASDQGKSSTGKSRTTATEKQVPSTVSSSGNHEVIEMTRMGKLIAKHMTDSVSTSAHVQSFVEVDVTAIVNWRNRVKKDFEQREGEKLTFTPIF
ncbi:MAG: biotin/lipoyl-containing protein, partial [Pricia sp.]